MLVVILAIYYTIILMPIFYVHVVLLIEYCCVITEGVFTNWVSDTVLLQCWFSSKGRSF